MNEYQYDIIHIQNNYNEEKQTLKEQLYDL